MHFSRTLAAAAIVVLAALAVVAWLSLAGVSPPAPVAADAPADQFSAERAFTHVTEIGAEMHPAGSPAAAGVRDHIVDTLEGLGLEPVLQEAVGADDGLGDRYAMGDVRNVVAVLPGTASTGRLVLMAHYDSVQVSYGANDDGAGVSTLLETARALTQGGPLRNDIVLLFTDAEEACLCGAEAFLDQDPLAADGGVAMNFESRGASGPAIMFETTRGNGDVVDMYQRAVPYPTATSFAVEVYRLLPNDTDFSAFRDSGRFTGLNTSYIDGSMVYHSPQDRPEYMDLASLQHHGSNALALARTFGDADIAMLSQPSADDRTYFPVFGTLETYPNGFVWPFAILALLAVGAFGLVARRRGLTSWPRLGAGFGLALIPLLLAPVAAQLLWSLLTLIRPDYRNITDPWAPGWFRLCVVALVATILLTWYGLLRKRFGAWTLAIGAVGWLAVLGIVLAALAPGGSYLAALPAIWVSLYGMVAIWLRNVWASAIALGVGAAGAVVVLVPTIALFFPALGLATGAAAALFAVLLGMSLLPVFELLYPPLPKPAAAAAAGADPAAAPDTEPDTARATRWWAIAPAALAGVFAGAFLGAGLAVDRFDAAHPRPTQLMYALNTDTGQAIWASEDAYIGDWTAQYVGERRQLGAEFGLLDDEFATGPAEPAALPAPQITVDADDVTGDTRSLTVTVTPQRDVRLLYVELPDATVTRATVQRREIPTEEIGDRFGLQFHAPPAAGVTFELEIAGTGPTTIRAMDGSDGLEELPGFVPRPADVGIQGSHTSELVLVSRSVTV